MPRPTPRAPPPGRPRARTRSPGSEEAASSLARRLRLRLCEVAVALLDDHGLERHEVAHADLAGGHLRQSAVAAVVGEPGGASDGRRGESPDCPERALAAAPEMTN